MATLRLITVQDFTSSRYGQLADQVEGRLDDVIAGAEDYVEHRVRRSFSSQTYTQLRRPVYDIIFLSNTPITSITSVKRRAIGTSTWTTLTTSDFEILSVDAQGDTGMIRDYTNTIAGFEVEVTYVAGYATIPYDIKEAVKLYTALLLYQDFAIYGADDGKEPPLKYINSMIDAHLAPYERRVIL